MLDPQAVLFDCDGVVLNSMPWHVKSWQEVFQELGARVEAEFIYRHEGALERSGLARMLADQGCRWDEKRIEDLVARQIEVFSARYSHLVEPYGQAARVLTRLKAQGLRLALVTSSSDRVIRESLPADILDRFEVVVTSSRVTNFKPHPEPYLTGLKGLGLEPDRAVAVENAPAGITSARAAGLFTYGLTTTLSADHLSQADRILGSLDDLAALLLNGEN